MFYYMHRINMFYINILCFLLILAIVNTQELNSRANILSISEQKCNEYGPTENDCDFQQEYVPGLIKANPKEFPHVALIGFGETDTISWNCNGFLISERYVLIAAHCATSRLGKPKLVRLGDLNTKSTTDDAQTQEFNIEKITVHPDFKGSQKYNDIAIVRLDKDVTFTPYVRPACLQTLQEFSSQNLINSGWGIIDWSSLPVDDMMKVTLQKYSHEECNATYGDINKRRLKNGIVDDLQICAGSPNPNNDICQGSAGSPLQMYHPKFPCMYTVVGLSSFSKGCGIANVPSVYTRISNYVPWIESIVWSN